ncbi:MAG TPA: serine/threonine-protein kinase, partial [Acidimicrobiales bacterium]|nr:serine/threonine-protein kinase [Acidimicrobiales bacterium]
RDRRLGRDVAIKFLRRDLAAPEAARQRFEDEARNAARLTHPNVVLVLDTGEHDGVPSLGMECLPGRTLRDELKEGPLPVARLTWIARDVLAGLAAAHEMGIVHRDVTPANILLTETGRAKLADFGIAKTLDAPSVTVVGQVLGTPAYVAPERLLGEPATPAADVYGVGATLYHALAGSPPFTGDSPIAIAHQAVSSRPERLEHLRPDAPLDLVAAVDHAMDPDPARRPTAEALAASLAGEETLGAETSALPVVGEDAGPETVAVGAVGAAGAAASPMATVAQPAVPPAPVRRGWRERRVMLATVGAAALIGLLLLALTDHTGGPETPARADTTASTVTTAVTAPPTTTPPVTARVVVRSPIRRAPKPDPAHHGPGKKAKH